MLEPSPGNDGEADVVVGVVVVEGQEEPKAENSKGNNGGDKEDADESIGASSESSGAPSEDVESAGDAQPGSTAQLLDESHCDSKGLECTANIGKACAEKFISAGNAVQQCVGVTGRGCWLASIHRVAGVFYGLGVASLLWCWVSCTPHVLDFASAVLATMAMLLLNSVDVSATVAPQLRQKVAILLGCAYFAMFLQISRAVWISVEHADDRLRECSCASYECFYGMMVVLSATIMRFVGPVFSGLWAGERDTSSLSTLCINSPSSVAVTCIMASLFVVAGLFLQAMATIGSNGSSSSLLVPMAYVFPSPCICMVHARMVASRNISDVWLAWSQFLPAAIYTVSAVWPVALQRNGVLTEWQGKTTLLATALILLGFRLGVCAVAAAVSAAPRANRGGISSTWSLGKYSTVPFR